MIVRSDKDARCAMMDVRLITGARFNKYLMVRGALTREISVVAAALVPEHVY